MPADLPATRDFASSSASSFNAEPVAPMASRVGSEREAFNARQRNRRSTLGNPLRHAIHEGCAGATLTAIKSRYVTVRHPAADLLLRVFRRRSTPRGTAT